MCDTAGSQQEEEGGWSAINHQLISGGNGETKGWENIIDVVVKHLNKSQSNKGGWVSNFQHLLYSVQYMPCRFLWRLFTMASFSVSFSMVCKRPFPICYRSQLHLGSSHLNALILKLRNKIILSYKVYVRVLSTGFLELLLYMETSWIYFSIHSTVITVHLITKTW